MPRNILIDPQRTGTGNPNIQFSGSMANTIRLEVLTSGSVQFAGVSGSLLSITDTLSGSLFAVSDVSGLPILETFSDDRIVMGQFNTNAFVVTGSQVGIGMSSPTATARLFVSGTSTSALSTLVVKAGVTSPLGAALDVQNSAGTPVFVVSGSGVVGIGTRTSTSPLTVFGTSDSGAITTSVAGIFKVFGSSSATLAVGSYLNSPFGLYLQTNAATYPIILQPAGGPIGIGTSTASARLHLLGSTTTTIPTLLVKEAQAMATATATLDVQNSAGTSLFFVSGSGNVGIGTNSTVDKLVVSGGNVQTARNGYIGSSATGLAIQIGTSGGSQIGFPKAGSNDDEISFITHTSTVSHAERMRITAAGNVGIGTSTNLSTLTVNGGFAAKSPSNVNAATYTVAATDYSLRFTTTNCTVTLPAAASFPGRILILNTITANSVTSNASNVIPLGSDTAGTAILAATLGKFAQIQSNGTNWITLTAN